VRRRRGGKRLRVVKWERKKWRSLWVEGGDGRRGECRDKTESEVSVWGGRSGRRRGGVEKNTTK